MTQSPYHPDERPEIILTCGYSRQPGNYKASLPSYLHESLVYCGPDEDLIPHLRAGNRLVWNRIAYGYEDLNRQISQVRKDEKSAKFKSSRINLRPYRIYVLVANRLMCPLNVLRLDPVDDIFGDASSIVNHDKMKEPAVPL